MLGLAGNARIFFYQPSIDMRKGFDGLSTIVENSFEENLSDGAYFVFLNKHRNRIKVLYLDQDGLAIWYKRLESGKFLNTKMKNSLLSRREFFMLLEGIVPKKLQKRWSSAA